MGSLEEKIGQMFLLGFRGYEVSEDSPIVEDIRERKIGGVILFNYDMTFQKPERNVESPEQVKALNRSLQEYSERPLFVSVDQEGGMVARLTEFNGFPKSRSAWDLGQKDDLAETRAEAEKLVEVLAEAQFNLNFAPDVDLRINPENPIIAGKERSYGDDPAKVAAHAREVIAAHSAKKIACTIKHFPGHGSSLTDTHLGFTDVTETWVEKELEVFRILLEDETVAPAVMTSHIFNAKFDPDHPATLSENIIGGMLRRRLGYDGVVFSDDMEMGAISSRYGMEESLLLAIRAGVDVFTYANNVIYQPDVGRRAIETVAGFVKDGRISEERIDESYRRIMKLKGEIGLL